jgi:hypothetical protein
MKTNIKKLVVVWIFEQSGWALVPDRGYCLYLKHTARASPYVLSIKLNKQIIMKEYRSWVRFAVKNKAESVWIITANQTGFRGIEPKSYLGQTACEENASFYDSSDSKPNPEIK